jgi:F0F1-type ATP synthase membrane subunit b/b'
MLKLSELLDKAKQQIAEEKETAALELLKERVREIEDTEKLLRTQKRQLSELLEKNVDDAEDF